MKNFMIMGLSLFLSYQASASCKGKFEEYLSSPEAQEAIEISLEVFKKQASSDLLKMGFDNVEFKMPSLPLSLKSLNINDLNSINGYSYRGFKVIAHKRSKKYKTVDSGIDLEFVRRKQYNNWGEKISDVCVFDITIHGGMIYLTNSNAYLEKFSLRKIVKY